VSANLQGQKNDPDTLYPPPHSFKKKIETLFSAKTKTPGKHYFRGVFIQQNTFFCCG
jgi:hypothetical protein